MKKYESEIKEIIGEENLNNSFVFGKNNKKSLERLNQNESQFSKSQNILPQNTLSNTEKQKSSIRSEVKVDNSSIASKKENWLFSKNGSRVAWIVDALLIFVIIEITNPRSNNVSKEIRENPSVTIERPRDTPNTNITYSTINNIYTVTPYPISQITNNKERKIIPIVTPEINQNK